MPARITLLGLCFALGLRPVAPVAAQGEADSVAASYHAIRWYEPLAVAGGIALAGALDEPVADHFRDHRSQTGDDVANAWAKVGTVGVGVVTVGVLAGGLLSHNDKVTHAGLRLLFSAAVAGVAAKGIQFVVGRESPLENTSAWSSLISATDCGSVSDGSRTTFAVVRLTSVPL